MPIKDVFAAAIVNKAFKQKLLDPLTRESALQGGYMGESFNLTEEELVVFKSIGSVETIEELARKFIGYHPIHDEGNTRKI